MLVINTDALSSLFLTLFCLTMTCPPFEHNTVIYLIMVAGSVAVDSLKKEGRRDDPSLGIILAVAQVAHQALFLLVNIFYNVIIALKVWRVRVHGVFGNILLTALIDNMTRVNAGNLNTISCDGKRMGVRTPTNAIKILADLHSD
jgi:hypothetical protein